MPTADYTEAENKHYQRVYLKLKHKFLL